MKKFFEEIYEAIKKHVNFDVVRVVVVGRCPPPSPSFIGNYNESVYVYLSVYLCA